MSRLVQVCLVVGVIVSSLQIIAAAPWIENSGETKERKPWKFEHLDWNRARKPDIEGGLTFENGNLYFTPVHKDSKLPTVVESNPQTLKLEGAAIAEGSILIAARPDPGPQAKYGYTLKDGVVYH